MTASSNSGIILCHLVAQVDTNNTRPVAASPLLKYNLCVKFSKHEMLSAVFLNNDDEAYNYFSVSA